MKNILEKINNTIDMIVVALIAIFIILFATECQIIKDLGELRELMNNDTTETYATESIKGSDDNEKAKEIKIIYTTESDFSLSEDTSESKSVEAVTDNQPIYKLTENEEYLLAKISQCEAGNCGIETRVKIMQCVYNRTLNDEFPDTILKVIYENNNGTYQFSPVASGGSWYYKEPTEEDYKALEIFKNKTIDDSDGILYFENCPNADNWHSRNLEYVNTYDGMRFYK